MFVYNGPGFFGGFLGVFSNGEVTDGSWKCKETDNPEDGWEQTNFNDSEWQYASIRQDNSGLNVSPRVYGIPPNVHWISPANHHAVRFNCRRRFSTEERNSNSSKEHFHVKFMSPDFVISYNVRHLLQFFIVVFSGGSRGGERGDRDPLIFSEIAHFL